MKPRSLLLAFLSLSLGAYLWAAESPAVERIEKSVQPVTVPFELLKSGHMAVMIKVNGKGPYRVIFDTGAPMNLLNNKLAKEVGLLKDAPSSTLPFLGTIGEVKVKELEIGAAKATNQDAIVMDHPLIELMSNKLGPLYGIVGFPFFARYKMTIDYQAETLTLVPSGFKPPNAMRALEATMMQLVVGGPQPARVLSPAGQWGLVARKPAGDEEAGVLVKDVLAGSAAAAAGLKPGDRLLTLDGRWTDTVADLYDAAGFVKPGATVTVSVKRDGKEMALKVKPRSGL